jgi:hypothetical protein
MFIHRPFLANSTRMAQSAYLAHIKICLRAARETVSLLHDAYIHRYYFRSWWYNSTYTLYASVIILYIILLNCVDTPASELIVDVKKALAVLHTMEDMSVAGRCADIISEILQVAEKYVAERGYLEQSDATHVASNASHMSTVSAVYPVSSDIIGNVNMIDEGTVVHTQDDGLYGFQQSVVGNGNGVDRQDLLASLMDPGVLEGFAIEANDGRSTSFMYQLSDMSWDGMEEFQANMSSNGGQSDSRHWN